LGFVLICLQWHAILDAARNLTDFVIVLTLLYLAVIASFLVHSVHVVPLTHLVGILVIHGMFLLFGLGAARAMPAVLGRVLVFASVYLIVIIQYMFRFGDLMRNGLLRDLFGIGDGNIYATFHQNIGVTVGLGALAALGLATSRARYRAVLFLFIPIFILLFHI